MFFEKQDLAIKFLNNLFPGATIYLFGSRARGTHRPESDIDLAIDNSGEPVLPRSIVQAKNVIEALNIPQMVDLIDLNRVPEEMKNLVLKEAIIIYEKPK